jgi:hypothetical protein
MDSKDYEYIQKEFKKQKEEGMKPVKFTKSLLDSLFNKYNTYTYTELYYDSEIGDDDRSYEGENMTDEQWEEYKNNYDSRSFNNWCDPYEEGIWGFTNQRVKKLIIYELNNLKKYQYTEPNEIRFYINETDEKTNIYFYGRDLDIQCDYWFSFYKQESSKCLTCKKDSCWKHPRCGKKVK